MSPSPFDEKKLIPNPFGRDIGLPLADEVDVPEINRDASESCRRLIQQVRVQHASAALTLFGDTGSGKSHLLGRVRRWLDEEPGALFVFISMDTSARMLGRHIRRCFVDALLRSNTPGRRAMDDLLKGRDSQLAELPERDLGMVLENLLKGRHLRDSAAWLRGQELPEAALQRLDLAQPSPDEDQERAARNIIVALCSLLEPGVVVFCLDQMEALQRPEGDAEGLDAVHQAFWVLRDKVSNACVISCVQTDFLPVLETLPQWVRDRMGSRQVIRQLNWDQARKLISARLSTLPASLNLPANPDDPLWPLAEPQIRTIFKDGAAPARKVISRCKDLFDQWAGKTRSEETLDAFLERMLEERMKPVEPGDAEAVFRNGLPLLPIALASPHASLGKGVFDFSSHNGSQFIALCNQANGKSLHSRLQKIDEAFKPGRAQKLILIRDSRLPIGQGAAQTRKHLKSIEDKGGHFVTVSPEAVASLAALRRLLADAKSRDLAFDGDSPPVSAVEAWITGHLPAALDALISAINPSEVKPRATDNNAVLSPKLADLLAQRKIVSLEQAAQLLASLPEEVEACAIGDPRLFGILWGGTRVLFQIVEDESLTAEQGARLRGPALDN